jgi:hypothetical protein
MTIHVREHITQFQYVYLPTISGFENLGDRRSLTYLRGAGSIYRETLTLVAGKPGPIAIGSAYLDAVDLRDGKTKRFISNDLVLNVMGPTVAKSQQMLRNVLLAILALLIFTAVLLTLVRVFRKKRPATENRDSTSQPAFAPYPAPSISLEQALANLRAQRDRSSVLRLREVLWSMAGAHQGETLSEVLQRQPARTNGLRGMLIATEHAAFVQDGRLPQAIEAALFVGTQPIAR